MLRTTESELQARVDAFVGRAGEAATPIKQESLVGGGPGPEAPIPSWGTVLEFPEWSGTELERRFRSFNPPVIVRVEEGRVILDFRTISRQKRTNCCGLFNTCCKPNGKDLHRHERLSGLF